MPEESGTETLQEQPEEQITEEEQTLAPQEGTGEEDTEGLSKNVQKRIDKLTKKMRDFEREAQEKETIIQDLLEIVKQKTVVETQVAAPQQVVSPETTMRQLRTMLNEARKDLDWDKVALLENEIDKVKDLITEQKISALRADHENKTKETESKTETERIVAKWVATAPWFDKDNDQYDPDMVGAAIERDKILSGKPEWKNKPLMERLNRVKELIEKRFNYNPPPKFPTVEGGNHGNAPQAPSMTLTDDERYVAHRMFAHKPAKEAEKIYWEQKQLKMGRA
jgi:hypothetical protein